MATAQEIWQYAGAVQPEAAMSDARLQVIELSLVHGLNVDSPLIVSPTSRLADPLVQSVETAGETVTVSRGA